MTNANWGLLGGGNNPLAMFQQGAAMGSELKQRQRERETDNALMNYAANPSAESVMGIVKANPRLGIQFQQQEKARSQQANVAELRRRAAAGDESAMSDLFATDIDAWSKLDGANKEAVKRAHSFMGEAVQGVGSLPEAQRPAAWANYVRQAEAMGMDIPAELEAYSPEALNGAAVRFGVVDKFLKLAEPDWRVVPQGGYLENVNPRSRSTPLQSGPPQQAAPPPPQGFVIDGGPTPTASGSFQP